MIFILCLHADFFSKLMFTVIENILLVSNSLDLEKSGETFCQAGYLVRPDLGPNCCKGYQQRADDKMCHCQARVNNFI